MLRFQDFAPSKKPFLASLRGVECETFEDAVATADEWMRREGIRPVSVETVIVPNLWRERGPTDADFAQHEYSEWYQFVRVWYEGK